MFHKKEYMAIASVLRHTNPGRDARGRMTWDEVRNHLATMFGAKNPKFQRNTFLSACECTAQERPLSHSIGVGLDSQTIGELRSSMAQAATRPPPSGPEVASATEIAQAVGRLSGAPEGTGRHFDRLFVDDIAVSDTDPSRPEVPPPEASMDDLDAEAPITESSGDLPQ